MKVRFRDDDGQPTPFAFLVLALFFLGIWAFWTFLAIPQACPPGTSDLSQCDFDRGWVHFFNIGGATFAILNVLGGFLAAVGCLIAAIVQAVRGKR